MFTFATAIVLLTGSAAGAQATAEIAAPDPKAMSQSEIRAFNAALGKDHKYYIRSKRSAATGSFIERELSCRTNEQWTLAHERSNQEARDIAERMAGKAVNSN